jgi:outer membrane lipopolysaccharide assembly protein LptE/RlpB
MRLRSLSLVVVAAVAATVALAGCSRKSKGPDRETLVAQLQQEAEALKAENENQDTSIGVSTTWTIASVDVVEQPDDEAAPWRGTIRYRIKAETSDVDGKTQVDEYDKEFAYTFNPTLQKWVFDYQP